MYTHWDTCALNNIAHILNTKLGFAVGLVQFCRGMLLYMNAYNKDLCRQRPYNIVVFPIRSHAKQNRI